ncbi:MAG: hypothetical protein M0Z50_05780 [Planctomycetia bacterium]|nr:hypothetical protein [Planctomycetia bacterium]
MDKLLALIGEGPNPRYTMKSVVLERYQDILKARQLMRTWADITEALGIARTKWKDLAMAFRRVDAGVKAGKLLPGKVAAASTMQRSVPRGAAPASVSSDEKPAFDFEAARIDKNR